MTGNLSMGSKYINNVITGGLGSDAANKSYVDTINSTMDSYVDVQDATKSNKTVYGYVSLMAGSAIVTGTNPANLNQTETSTYKNNYIYAEFPNGSANVAQWVYDMPGDWNSSDATNGKVTYNVVWTGPTGSGNVNWSIAGVVLPDAAALDTNTPYITSVVDTLGTAEYKYVSPDTTPALITSAGAGGRTIIMEVNRSYVSNTYTGTAKLISLRIKYIRTLGWEL
jgi:hypothetical protein